MTDAFADKTDPQGREDLITREAIGQAAAYIRARAQIAEPAWGIVFGSGLGGLAESVEDATVIDYRDVPHMCASTAPLHAGRFVVGHIAGAQVVCMQGRLHAYEGYSAQQIVFPIYVMNALGVRSLVVTNAAGGIDPSFGVGELMLIEDHINFQPMNACAGPERVGLHPRFFDMTQAYDPELRARALRAAGELGLAVRSGVYLGDMGPSFETPAEIRAFRALGADAVGMSTVQEVIAARSLGMPVLGISMVSNPAAGVVDEPLSMDDVSIAAQRAAADVERLIARFLEG